MELTQNEIQFIKNIYAENIASEQASILNKQIEDARMAVAEKYKTEMEAVKTTEERKALLEIIATEANIAEAIVVNN